jgi:hypothetical protein
LAEAQKVSHTGSIFWHILSGKIYWSDETFRIFEFPPATPPALELMFKRIILKTGDLFGIEYRPRRGNDAIAAGPDEPHR